MRALFMDFPHDPQVAGLTDEYMFGPAFLAAPVLDQGTTSRRVYLPAGTDWYDWWTNVKSTGGRTGFVRQSEVSPTGSGRACPRGAGARVRSVIPVRGRSRT